MKEKTAIEIFAAPRWKDYELIDTGDKEKLERFGRYIIRRPEPQAIWNKSLPDAKWQQLANATFTRKRSDHYRDADPEGQWQRNDMPETWQMSIFPQMPNLKMRLGLTSFKHVGIFPEQACNWTWLTEKLQDKQNPKVLNLFAYTGAASLVSQACGADTVHLDAVKQMISWARENMELSHLDNIRWVVEDALKFVQREVKRGNKYDCIILDPPAYGRGPKGEKWLIEEHLPAMLENVGSLLKKDGHLLLNVYSIGLSSLILQNLVMQVFPDVTLELGELCIADRAGRHLPLSIVARF